MQTSVEHFHIEVVHVSTWETRFVSITLCEAESLLIFHLDYTSGESSLHTGEDYPVSSLLSLVSSSPFSSLHVDWLLLWPRLCAAPTNSEGAGIEYEYTLESHWQVSLVIIGQTGHRGSKRLLTLMIWVSFPSTPKWLPSNCCLLMALVQRMTSPDCDRQGLNRQMVIRSNNEYLQVSAQTNVGRWAMIIISQGHFYWQQDNSSLESLKIPRCVEWRSSQRYFLLQDMPYQLYEGYASPHGL